MKIHREGRVIVIVALFLYLIFGISILLVTTFNSYCFYLLSFLGLILFVFVLFFFRNPSRKIIPDNNLAFAPADGEIVSIEEVDETEFLMMRCLRVSIFMSVLNMHVNRYPVSGIIRYSRYHPGRFFIAFYPKASEFNEHQSTVIEKTDGTLIMVKQIAGFVARRVVCYAREGEQAIQGNDIGFIKFGSRVDLFLPLNTQVLVKMHEEVQGNRTIIARFNV